MSRIRIEMRDKDFNVKEILDKEYYDLRWSYARIGGCGDFSFSIPRKRFEERAIRGENNIRVYYRDPETDTWGLRYQGLINNKIPVIRGNSENMQISGHGYINQLSRVYLNNVSYTSQEASVIVKNILDNYVTTDTNVSYSASDLEATSFTFDSLAFNDNSLTAMQKIADTVGEREWGVDANRKFYFKARSETIGFRYFLGKQIRNFEDNQDFSEIINRVFVQGAQVGGTYHFFGPYNDVPSQTKYNIRTRVVQNSSVTTSTVGSQIGTSVLSEFSEVSRKASCDLINISAQLEATTPIALFNEISRKIKYGQKKYGTFLYSGLVNRLINKINYSVTNNGNLETSIELGQQRPSLAEQLGQLEYKLEQTRSAAL